MFSDVVLKISRQLYPTGRAYKMPVNGVLERLHDGLAISEAQAYSDAQSVLFSILPDNDNFTTDDATQWERRLGLITNTSVSLSDRKKAIQRKMNHPGNIPARQSYLYMQEQLQAAGFDVYVYENIFPTTSGVNVSKSPIDVLAASYGNLAQHGTGQHGNFQHGGGTSIAKAKLLSQIRHSYSTLHGSTVHGFNFNNIIANRIDEYLDFKFFIGNTFNHTFFIGGNPIASYADVSSQRKKEFRQLILRIKPLQTAGFLFINYI